MTEQESATATGKRFTRVEANAMLPLIKSIVGDIRDSFQSVTSRRADLHRLFRKGSHPAGQLYDDEMAESRADLQREYDQIWALREELESLGVYLRQPEEGTIEFPAMIDGREGFYCWRLGEDEILHWREVDAPHSTRHPLGLRQQASQPN